MAPARDLPAVQPVRLRYLICSAPRVGSNLLCALLRQTGLAGDPLEYLNPRYQAARQRAMAMLPASLDAYLDELEARRSSPNGVFGLKVHHSHLIAACHSDPVQMSAFVARFNRIILMRRRDRLAQAISLDMASKTGFWTAEDREAHRQTGNPEPVVNFSPLRIAKALESVIAEDAGWRKLLAQSKTPLINISYEELSANPGGITQQVCRFLGIEAPPPSQPAPLARQSDARNTENYRKFLAYCGIIQA